MITLRLIAWSQWTTDMAVQKTKIGLQEMLVDEAVLLLLKSKVDYVLFYVYIKREQAKYFEKLKTEITDVKIVL